MKNTQCPHYSPTVKAYLRRYANGEYYEEYELVDEVCTLDTPKHHNEYDCSQCPLNEGKEKS